MPLPNSGVVHPRLRDELARSAVGTAGMPDTGTITRPGTGQGTVDPATLVLTPPAPTLVWVGQLRIQAEATQQTSGVDVGDRSVALHRYRASIPADANQVLVDDVLTITTSSDPLLARRIFVVRDVHYDTFQVRRYLLLEDHPEQATPGA